MGGYGGKSTKELIEANARQRERVAARAAARKARSVVGQIENLVIGASCVFPQYARTPQVSNAIHTVHYRSGGEFRSSQELSLIDGSVCGVRVTRIA